MDCDINERRVQTGKSGDAPRDAKLLHTTTLVYVLYQYTASVASSVHQHHPQGDDPSVWSFAVGGVAWADVSPRPYQPPIRRVHESTWPLVSLKEPHTIFLSLEFAPL